MTLDPNEAGEKFQEFLMLMDEQIDWLESEADSQGINISLTEDATMLDRLESLFDALSKDKDRDTIAQLGIVFSRYLGEWVRLRYGGAWHLPLDDPKNVNFNMPVIEGHTKVPGLQLAPILVLRAYALRRQRGILLRAITAQIEPTALDLGGLLEEG